MTIEATQMQSKSDGMGPQNQGNAKERKSLRLRGRNKGKEKEKKGPKLGAGGAKGPKEMADNELEMKLTENEEKRRQWLMTWHLEVDQMHMDLWDMQETLANSLVRSDSAKARDRENRFQVTKPQMTEEEIQKLPVRMRPKPKYKAYLSNKEMSDINIRSYRKIIRNLHDTPRRFEMTPDSVRQVSGKSRFPHIQVGGADFDKYRILLLKNPFNKSRERNDILLRSRTDFLQVPAGPGKPYYKIQTSRSADVTSSLPHLKIPNMPDSTHPGNKGTDPDTTLPSLSKDKQDNNTKVLSPVKETITELPVASSPTLSISDEADSIGADSDESGYMMAIKAKRQAAAAKRLEKKQVGQAGELGMPEKNQLNMLEDANYRKTLIQELDQKRQDRAQNNKWGMVKNAFKATGMLKVKMPDVIKDQAKSKHHNRAIDQVQERIKAKQGTNGNDSRANQGLNRRLSQSMGALDNAGQPHPNKARY